ncbi:hypothetical protein XHC_0207 [Xanthomonas hortorum pv. carotae str. M081]|nr:hypothetical protein XHC_0207 [Xanthomonas hortorum pv. carotae str. M081]
MDVELLARTGKPAFLVTNMARAYAPYIHVLNWSVH